MNVYTDDIIAGIREAGLSGASLCLHSSLRSFGRVEGGAGTVVDAFLKEGCTVMVPAFSYDFEIPAPEEDRPSRNGYDYSKCAERESGVCKIFDTDSKEISVKDMGVIPAEIVSRDDRIRGCHPINSFAAVGPKAYRLVSGQEPMDVYAPFEELCSDNGYIVLAGVGLTNMTALHYAEKIAGRNLFKRWAYGKDGKPIRMEVGSCSRGFGKLDAFAEAIEMRVQVGNSLWRVYPAKELVEVAAEAIRREPMITHCGIPGCGRCDDAVAGGPLE